MIRAAWSCLRASQWERLQERYTNPKRLRLHLDAICKKRGVAPYFDRFQSDRVQSDGLRLHLDILEVKGATSTVVFMPGTNAYGLLYGDFLVALADRGHNVVSFDPRGHGRSEGARGSYVLSELVRDMETTVSYARQRFKGTVSVAGSSQGGIVAFYYAAQDPSVACAICHNAADLGAPESVELIRYPTLGRWLRPLLLQAADWAPEFPVLMTAYLDLAREPVRHFGSAQQVLYWDPLLVPYVRLKTLASLGNTPLPCDLRDIRVPIMLLQAGRDTIFSTDYIRRLYDGLTCQKTLQLYPDLHHYMIVDSVDEWIDDVASWLDTHAKTTS